MKVAAIIAEYNPFHTGHQYHLTKTRELTGADYILVIMSGNFVQRGAPAFLDKYTRTRMALLGGADAVIELPTLYATSSAEYFAQGGVSLANRLGVVDILSFGSESGSLLPLMDTASALISCETQSQDTLRPLLRQGLSYPAARKRAVAESFSSSPDMASDSLTSPNNILGVEYCRALLASQSCIVPFTLPRQGGGYHETNLNEDGSSYASATAIRSFIRQNCQMPEPGQAKSPAVLNQYIPAKSRKPFQGMIASGAYLLEDDLSLPLHYKLLTGQKQGFSQYLDCSTDLSAKIIKSIPGYTGFTDFCRLLKSRDVTYSRISRMLLHILLGITSPAFYLENYSDREYFLPYGRLLGFRQSSTALLSSIKKNSALPLVTKLPDARKSLTGEALDFLDREIFYSSVYEAALQYKRRYNKKTALNELRQSPVIVP